jgi:hypothetical protein
VNKFLAYTVVAILLGSVMMVVPLAVLGPDNLVPDDGKYNTLGAGEETAQRNDSQLDTLTIPPSNGTETYDNSSQYFVHQTESEGADVASGLSSMGLMVFPSFLVALGVFVYLKKRTA